MSFRPSEEISEGRREQVIPPGSNLGRVPWDVGTGRGGNEVDTCLHRLLPSTMGILNGPASLDGSFDPGPRGFRTSHLPGPDTDKRLSAHGGLPLSPCQVATPVETVKNHKEREITGTSQQERLTFGSESRRPS